jgi:hypothetical protein
MGKSLLERGVAPESMTSVAAYKMMANKSTKNRYVVMLSITAGGAELYRALDLPMSKTILSMTLSSV